MREIIAGIRQRLPQMRVGVRSASSIRFPTSPVRREAVCPSRAWTRHCYWFGADPADPSQINLEEPKALLKMLQTLGVELVNLSGGSPYYNPHIQRPALFPPSDGYLPPEDPLVGVARQVRRGWRAQAQLPRAAHRRLSLQLFAGMAAQRGAVQRAQRVGRFRRHWARDALLPRDALRCAGGGNPCSARKSAARSATAPPRRAMGWSRAATRWMNFTSRRKWGRSWGRSNIQRKCDFIKRGQNPITVVYSSVRICKWINLIIYLCIRARVRLGSI